MQRRRQTGRKDGQINEWIDGGIEREKETRKQGTKEGWMDGRTEENAKGQTNTRKTRRDGLEDR